MTLDYGELHLEITADYAGITVNIGELRQKQKILIWRAGRAESSQAPTGQNAGKPDRTGASNKPQNPDESKLIQPNPT